MAKKQVDAEQLVDNLQNAKFGLSIQNIVAIVTVLSSLIAGWYTFTGRIDSLEEVVQGFAETSDIELVAQKLETFEKDIDYMISGHYHLGEMYTISNGQLAVLGDWFNNPTYAMFDGNKLFLLNCADNG